jgi:hypothetical protein
VDVLAAALQQQVATCSSLQVRWCCHVCHLPYILSLCHARREVRAKAAPCLTTCCLCV